MERSVEEALADARQAERVLAATLQAGERRATRAEEAETDFEHALAAARAAKAAEDARMAKIAEQARMRGSATTGGPPAESIVAGQEFMARHPEVKSAVFNLYRAQTAAQFGSVYRALGFSPAQIEQFEKLMMQSAGVTRMVPTADGQTAILSVSSWDREKKREDETQLVALLGPNGIQLVREAIQTLPARTLVAQLAGTLYATSAPLTVEQASQLTRVVASSRPPQGQSGSQYNWDTILSNARAVLSLPQLAAFSGLQAEEDYQQAMRLAMRRNLPPGRK